MTDTASKINPLVHIGGSGKANLMEQYCFVCNALCDALKALRYASPHPRDYPTGGYQDARFEHTQQVLALEELHASYQTLIDRICEE